MSYRIVRASEIGEYVYCRRAWWLRHIHGHEPHNTREISAGTRFHARHQAAVRQAVWLQRLAIGFIFLAAAFLAFRLAGG